MSADKTGLRLAEWEDLPLILEWRNSPRIRACMINQREITADEHRKWWATMDKQKQIVMMYQVNGVSVGVVNIYNIDTKNGTCEWGFYIGEGFTWRGLGTSMCEAAIKYIFGTLWLRKITGEVLHGNLISMRLHSQLGFTKEGVLKDQIDLGLGCYQDLVIFGLISNKSVFAL